MEEQHRQILRRNRSSLVKGLKVEELWDLLIEKGVFSNDMIEEIQSAGARRDQARQLVTDLETRGSQAFPLFLLCLQETGQNQLADALLEQNGGRVAYPIPKTPYPVCKPADKKVISGRANKRTVSWDTDKDYPVTSDPCGYCLIINNMDFQDHTNLSYRAGSDIDRQKLERRLRTFHFEVVVKNNLTGQEIHDELRGLAGKDHSQRDCCAVVLLSHGCETRHMQFPGGVYGTDGARIPVERIVNYFNGSNSASLRGKPKLFFIQACGGDQKDRGFEVDSEDPPRGHAADPPRGHAADPPRGHAADPPRGHAADPPRGHAADPPRGHATDPPRGHATDTPRGHAADSLQSDATPVRAGDDTDEMDAVASLPTASDILVSYSTFPGFVSWRDKVTGSWYVENLDNMLGEHAATEDLQTMLVMVANAVSAKGTYKQIPGYVNFLRKRFFFKTD